MTDVSNLDDLANAISNKSPAIRKYAQAQASASQAQELDIRTALTTGGSVGPAGPPGPQGPPGPTGPMGPSGSGAAGWKIVLSPGQDVQAAINAAPAGSAIAFQPGIYSVPSGRSVLADASSVANLRLVGLGGVGYNTPAGVIFQTSAAGQTLVRDYQAAGVNHNGVEVEHIIFNDGYGNGLGVDVYNTNHVRLNHLQFIGRFERGCIWFKQDLALTADCAWHMLRDIRMRTVGPAVVSDPASFSWHNGVIINDANPNGQIQLLGNTQSCTLDSIYSAAAGCIAMIEGGGNTFSACVFEQYAKDSVNVPVIQIRRSAQNMPGGGQWPMSGQVNDVQALLIPHEYGSPGAHASVGANCYDNKLELRIISSQKTINDQGGRTLKEIR